MGIYVDTTFTLFWEFTNDADEPADPTAIVGSIRDPLGNVVRSLQLSDLTKDAPGKYHFHYDTGDTAAVGSWLVVCKATTAGLDDVSAINVTITAPGSLWGVSGNAVWVEAGSPAIEACGFPSQAALEAHIITYILPAAQDNINEYLNQSYDDDSVPQGLKYAAMRVAANALIKIAARKMGPLVRISDYRVETIAPDVFMPEIKAEIDCYKAGAVKATRTTTKPVASAYMTDEMQERHGELDSEEEDDDD
jgi:hypothetical protein